jgi:MazG family protein
MMPTVSQSADSPHLRRLLAIMARLRDPSEGCPWDREQDFGTIAPYTIEEAYEVADAIARGDMRDLRDELGDLLFQVVFHARMAEEAGHFAFDDVARAIADKMERRHPHVFARAETRSATEQSIAWEAHKATERRDRQDAGGALDGVPLALPALLRAEKLGKRAAGVGFDWPDVAGVVAKIREESDELGAAMAAGEPLERIEHEVGDLLFAVAQLARHAGINPETALRKACGRFERRFVEVERALAATGRAPSETTLDELEALW